MRRLPTLLLLALALGAVIRLARRELNAPPDRTGAAVPLDRHRHRLGASPNAHLVARPEEPEWVRDLALWEPAVPRTRHGRLLGYLWASPASLVGLLLGLVSGGKPSFREGAVLFTGVKGPVGAGLRRGGFAATTLGHVVLSLRKPSAALMAHELAHSRQAERLGPFMGAVYWYLLARYGYARHPLERSARRAGRMAAGSAQRRAA